MQFHFHLDNESDRGCALMTSSFLDQLLKNLLKAFMIDDPDSFDKLFTGTAGMATFSSRIEMSYHLFN